MWNRAIDSTRSPPKTGGTELEGGAGLVHHFLWIEIHAQPGAFDLAVEFDILFVAGQSGLAPCSLLGKEEHCRRNEPFFVALVADVAGGDLLLGLFHIEEGICLIETLIMAHERSHVLRLHNDLIFYQANSFLDVKK